MVLLIILILDHLGKSWHPQGQVAICVNGPRTTRGPPVSMGHRQRGDSCYTYQVPPLRIPAICDRWNAHVHLRISRSSIVTYHPYPIGGHDPRSVPYSPDGPPPALLIHKPPGHHGILDPCTCRHGRTSTRQPPQTLQCQRTLRHLSDS